MSRLIPLFLFAVLAFAPTHVFAQAAGTQNAASLGDRLDRLEKRLMALEGRTLPSGNSPAGQSGSALADMEQRVAELETEGNQINGGVERLSNAVERLAKHVDELAKDFDLRLRDLEASAQVGGAGGGQVVVGAPVAPAAVATIASSATVAAAVAAGTPSPSAASATVPAAASPTVAIPDGLKAQEQYNRAYAYLTAADYPNAKAWLEDFLKKFPKDALADNANYWLGEVHLVQNDPQGAVVAFKNGLTAFPKGQKAPANLFKMGLALQQMKQDQFAKGAWEKLVHDFPRSPEAEKAKAKLAELSVATESAKPATTHAPKKK